MADLVEWTENLQEIDRKLSKVITRFGFLYSSINSHKDCFCFFTKEIVDHMISTNRRDRIWVNILT